MNRDFDRNDNPRKNHYADFDQYGNPRTGNRNSLSRYNPNDRGSEDGRYHPERRQQGSDRGYYENQRQHERNRISSDARAYGDFSGGTRYGEGGSTYGGGSAYGPSNYGSGGERGPRSHSGDRSYYDHNEHSRQNYGRSGGYNYSGRMGDSEMSYRGTGYIYGSRPGSGGSYGNLDRENRGYDRGYGGYGRTGYGSTGFDNRDEDRERSISRNSDYRNERRHNEGGQGWNFDRRDRNSRDWND